MTVESCASRVLCITFANSFANSGCNVKYFRQSEPGEELDSLPRVISPEPRANGSVPRHLMFEISISMLRDVQPTLRGTIYMRASSLFGERALQFGHISVL